MGSTANARQASIGYIVNIVLWISEIDTIKEIRKIGHQLHTRTPYRPVDPKRMNSQIQVQSSSGGLVAAAATNAQMAASLLIKCDFGVIERALEERKASNEYEKCIFKILALDVSRNQAENYCHIAVTTTITSTSTAAATTATTSTTTTATTTTTAVATIGSIVTTSTKRKLLIFYLSVYIKSCASHKDKNVSNEQTHNTKHNGMNKDINRPANLCEGRIFFFMIPAMRATQETVTN
uniref:Uncharacterized protein n=1 Tax=Glossina austeni TaxID=7395 RepID=A0A1A9VTN7_GLOAU